MSMRQGTGIGLAVLAGIFTVWACDSGDVIAPPGPDPDPEVTPTTASGWVSYVNWDQRTVVEVDMVETSDSEMSFSPSNLTFEAGKPYVLRILNPVENGSKHYFSPEGLGNFYKAVATRKIQTADAEYKAAHFDAVELKIGGALEIFFVPVLAGTYDIVCTIPGHKGFGMVGTVTITGGAGYQLDLEVAPDFDRSLTNDPRRSGGHAVWSTATDVTVGMGETETSFAFVPPDIQLSSGVAYRLGLDNDGSNASKHYYTAEEFYKTVVMRKAEDSEAEIKAPYLRAVELLVGGSTELFIVPTASGTFEVICTIPGHAELGMTGTITVDN